MVQGKPQLCGPLLSILFAELSLFALELKDLFSNCLKTLFMRRHAQLSTFTHYSPLSY